MKFQNLVSPCALFIGIVVVASSARAADKPLKVFVMAGQSNMQGHAHVRTLDALAMDPRTRPMLHEIRDSNGEPRIVEDVWISSIGSSEEEKFGRLTVGYGAEQNGPKIGPELTFGIYMHKWLGEPILIIKTAWGGKSLHTDFRPPSAGPYEFNDSQMAAFQKQRKDLNAIRADKKKATGHYYRLMIEHVNKVLGDLGRVYPDYDPSQGHELAGFVWFQGWNDMVDQGVYPNRNQPGGYEQYSEVLAHFIRDVRKDLKAPELPFVIGVMGAGGPTDKYSPDQMRYKPIHDHFRNAIAAPAELPEFQGNVTAVRTEKYWDMKLAELRTREAAIKQQVSQQKKEQSLDRDAEQALLQKLRGEEFTDPEREYLEKSVSNFEFHYLGSAKILSEIGKGFAEAMAAMVLQVEKVPADQLDQSNARNLLRAVVAFYRTHVGHRGAYLWRYGADLSWQEGEGVASKTSVCPSHRLDDSSEE